VRPCDHPKGPRTGRNPARPDAGVLWYIMGGFVKVAGKDGSLALHTVKPPTPEGGGRLHLKSARQIVGDADTRLDGLLIDYHLDRGDGLDAIMALRSSSASCRRS